MVNLTMLFTCLLAGVLLRRFGRAPENTHAALNVVIVNVALPAVALHSLRTFPLDAKHLAPVAMPWLLFALGAATFWAIGRWWRWPRATVGALTLVGGLGNTSFVGVPMIETLHGRDGIGLGLLIDQLGSYLVVSTAGVVLATWYAAGQRPDARTVLCKVMCFPPFVALLAALLLADVPVPAMLDGALQRIGEMLAPLALLSVGLQLRIGALRGQVEALAIGLSYKLVACPALVIALLWWLGADATMTNRVSVIEAAMPPMNGVGIVAANAKLAPELVSLLIGIGIPIGLLTSALWHGAFVRLAG